VSEPGTLVDKRVIESFHRSIERGLINPNKNKTKGEMNVLIHDDLTNYLSITGFTRRFLKTLKQHEEEIRASLDFV
jgi:putative transposase